MERWGKSSRRQRSSSVLCAVLLIVQWSCYTSADDSTSANPTSVITTPVSQSVSTVQSDNSTSTGVAEITAIQDVTDSPRTSTLANASTPITESVTQPEKSSLSPESKSSPTVGGDASLQATPLSTTSTAMNTVTSSATVSGPTIHSPATASAVPTQSTVPPQILPTTTAEKAPVAADTSNANAQISKPLQPKKVFITILVLGCLTALAMLVVYYWKDKHSWSPKPVRLVEAGRPESDCRGNTAMSDVPNEPPADGQEKPKLNGENQSPASATGNGHQKKNDETDTEV